MQYTMKSRNKLIGLLLCVSVITTMGACTKDKEADEGLDIPKNITIEVGEDYNLNVNQEWTSTKDFVALVDGSGKISGSHVGECDILCNKGKCHVTVNPNYTLYREPLCENGLTKDYVLSMYGTPYSDNEGTIIYETGQESAPYVMYMFENGTLKDAAVVVKKTYESSLKKHLNNRYVYIQYDDGFYQYTNAYTWEEVTKIVMYRSYNSSYYIVMYMPQ